MTKLHIEITFYDGQSVKLKTVNDILISMEMGKIIFYWKDSNNKISFEECPLTCVRKVEINP